MSLEYLDNIRIVLVEPSHPGNIGAAARAMRAMGLKRLTLVAPGRFPHADATTMAAGADQLLADARLADSLAEAVGDCTWVVGTSARDRRLPWPSVAPREAGRQAVANAASGAVAVVFGRERSGLRNDELDLCHAHVQIPAAPDYASLNLAAAVQVLTYELRLAALEGAPDGGSDHEEVDVETMEGFYGHLRAVIEASGFLDPDNPGQLMRRFRRLFNRARPDAIEINILRGMLKSLDPRRR